MVLPTHCPGHAMYRPLGFDAHLPQKIHPIYNHLLFRDFVLNSVLSHLHVLIAFALYLNYPEQVQSQFSNSSLSKPCKIYFQSCMHSDVWLPASQEKHGLCGDGRIQAQFLTAVHEKG